MNELYPFVEQVIKKYSHDALIQLYQQLSEHPGNAGEQFNCSVNEEYVIKRFITAALSRETEIKFNAYLGLSTIMTHLPHLETSLNVQALSEYILTQSDIKKNCVGKAIEIQAYVIGKILIVKALRPLFKDNIEIIAHLIELGTQFAEVQEQIIQLTSQIAVNKKAQVAFSKINPNTKAGFLLFTILRSKLKGHKLDLNESAIVDVIGQLVPQYPRRSICLTYLGSELINCLQNPSKFLEEQFQTALGNDTQDLNVKMIFYLLQLIESHLAGVVISKQNVWKCINPSLVKHWLSQLKVQNKHIKTLAESIKIHFQQNPELVLQVLKQLHEAGLNLSINIKHPLYSLLEMVQPDTYFDYLLELCNPENSSVDTEEEPKPLPINVVEVFIGLAGKNIKAELLSKAVELFVNRYHSNKDENQLQSLSGIFNHLLSGSQKKKKSLTTKESLILAKLNFDSLELGQTVDEIKETIKDIRNKFKEAKQEQNPFIITYLNFLLNVGFYFLMHPEEVEIYADLKMAFEEIKANYFNQEQGLIPKKKRKLNPENQKNKPIHILVDVFITLLTKSPQFLRTAINNLFEQIIPYIDTEDLKHLLEVIQRPDQQYLEEIQEE